jgi:hypothetical protein
MFCLITKTILTLNWLLLSKGGSGNYQPFDEQLVEINFSFGDCMRLSEDIKKWRAERPDEWTMDRFYLEALRLEAVEEKLKADNNARDEICRCGNKKDWEHIRNFVGWRNFNHCPECGGKLSTVA